MVHIYSRKENKGEEEEEKEATRDLKIQAGKSQRGAHTDSQSGKAQSSEDRQEGQGEKRGGGAGGGGERRWRWGRKRCAHKGSRNGCFCARSKWRKLTSRNRRKKWWEVGDSAGGREGLGRDWWRGATGDEEGDGGRQGKTKEERGKKDNKIRNAVDGAH